MSAPDPAVARPLRVTRRFDAPAARVFDAWLDPSLARRWLFAAAGRPLASIEIDARARGAFRLTEGCGDGVTVHAGHFVEIARPRRLAFMLEPEAADAARAATHVAVDIASLEAGCRIVLTQDGVSRQRAAAARGRWEGMLYGLATVLDADGAIASRRTAEPQRAARVVTFGQGGTSCNTC